MVAGLAFLSKKGFNPANIKNQKTVWEAQQQKETEKRRIKEREDQLRRERDDEELARVRGGEREGDRAKLKFMYDVPPGGPTTNNDRGGDEESDLKPAAASTPAPGGDDAKPLAAERQPGDDDAAAAFRQMLAAATSNQQQNITTAISEESATGMTAFSDRNGAALSGTTIEKDQQGKNEQLSALEKAVGRRDANSGLTLEEQIARFPQLKNAPMAKGMTATNVNVTFKPLGTQLRNTRCFVCGVWGHSKGDRECAMSGWDPFSSSNRPSMASVQANEGVAAGQDDSRSFERSGDDEDGKRRARDDYSSDSSSDSDRRRRKRHRKKHKSRRRESKRRRRSSSPDERRRRKSSHKRRKKHSRHDDD